MKPWSSERWIALGFSVAWIVAFTCLCLTWKKVPLLVSLGLSLVAFFVGDIRMFAVALGLQKLENFKEDGGNGGKEKGQD